ncbi:hypothetical protein KO481_42465, partial [Nocardia sp. NEAU-G5]
RGDDGLLEIDEDERGTWVERRERHEIPSPAFSFGVRLGGYDSTLTPAAQSTRSAASVCIRPRRRPIKSLSRVANQTTNPAARHNLWLLYAAGGFEQEEAWNSDCSG